MCQLGASAENGFRLSYDSVWPLHVYSGSVVPYGLYDDSLLIPFTFNAQSESFGESQQAEYFIRLVVPYYDDSYRRLADVVNESCRLGGLKREPSCSGGLGLFTFLFAFSVSFGYTLFFLSIRGVVGAVYAGIAGMRMLSSLGTSSRFCLLLLISYCVHNADAVTCYTCYDQCPFITRTTANRAILSGAVLAGGAATSVSLLHLLPLRFLRILTRSVLDSLRTVARRPAAGTPVDLTAMNHQELVTAVQTGASSVESGLREVLDRIGAATTSAEVSKLSALQSTMTNVNKQGASLGQVGVLSEQGILLGAFTYAYAQAGRIARSSASTVATAGVISFTEDSKSDARDTVVQEKIVRPTSEIECCNFFSIWQMICHATGLADVLVTGTFLQDVFFTLISHQGRDWQLGHELFLVYLDALETSADTTTTIGNVYLKGSQDTYLNMAMKRVQELYPKHRPGQGIFRDFEPPDDKDKGGGKVKFNGAWNTKATTKCITFNLGNKDHPTKCLNANGSCKFLHACDHWVSDKGPRGQCGGNHPRTKCNNPNKCDEPVAA